MSELGFLWLWSSQPPGARWIPVTKKKKKKTWKTLVSGEKVVASEVEVPHDQCCSSLNILQILKRWQVFQQYNSSNAHKLTLKFHHISPTKQHSYFVCNKQHRWFLLYWCRRNRKTTQTLVIFADVTDVPKQPKNYCHKLGWSFLTWPPNKNTKNRQAVDDVSAKQCAILVLLGLQELHELHGALWGQRPLGLLAQGTLGRYFEQTKGAENVAEKKQVMTVVGLIFVEGLSLFKLCFGWLRIYVLRDVLCNWLKYDLCSRLESSPFLTYPTG